MPVSEGIVDVAIATRDHPEGEPGFGHPHGRAFCAVEVSRDADDFFGEGLGVIGAFADPQLVTSQVNRTQCGPCGRVDRSRRSCRYSDCLIWCEDLLTVKWALRAWG